MQSWQKRWYVLDGEYSCKLFCFTDDTEVDLRGFIELAANSTLSYKPGSGKHQHIFRLTAGDQIFCASAGNQESCDAWMAAIERVISFLRAAQGYTRSLLGARGVGRAFNALSMIPHTLELSHWGHAYTIQTAVAMAKSSSGLSDFGFNGKQHSKESRCF